VNFEYRVVDVFTQTPLEGNPLAVFTDARGLAPQQMQRIARELNLSETSFILPSERADCDARVRIFTPTMEMRFAGHPTIGTAYVARECGIVAEDRAQFALEEIVGAVPIRVEGGAEPLLWLQTPPISYVGELPHDAAASLIGLETSDLIDGIPCDILTAGNPNVYIPVRDPARVDRAWVETAAQRSILGAQPEPTCVFVFAPVDGGAYSRMFSPEHGVVEDPATGSATGPLAAFMMENGLAPVSDGTHLISEQGTKMGRRSLLHILIRGENGVHGIDVGGHVRPVARATMTL
jgi:trans-2,3-dihydro-3-hydroxyanthranilate isomerase